MKQELTRIVHYLFGMSAGNAAFSSLYEENVHRICAGSNPSTFSHLVSKVALKHRFFLMLLDPWTRLFDPKSLLRCKLNFVVALAECDPLLCLKLQRKTQGDMISVMIIGLWLVIRWAMFLLVGTLLVAFLKCISVVKRNEAFLFSR